MGNAEVVTSVHIVLMGYILTEPHLSLKRGQALLSSGSHHCNPSSSSLRFLSKSCTEKAQILTLTPRLNSADLPMKFLY